MDTFLHFVAHTINLLGYVFASQLFSFVIHLVPAPTVSVTAPNNQTVGQSLTLPCNVTTVRGINGTVDFMWSSNGTVLRRTNGTAIDNSVEYTDSYTISQLNITDDGRVIQCEVVINASLAVMANDSITLDVTGMYICDILIHLNTW